MHPANDRGNNVQGNNVSHWLGACLDWSLQCSRKNFMVHQTFVWRALYILLKFVKSLIRHLAQAIRNVRHVRWFSWTLPLHIHTYCFPAEPSSIIHLLVSDNNIHLVRYTDHQKLEYMHSENTPPPPPPHTHTHQDYPYHWVMSDHKSNKRKSQTCKFKKNCQKFKFKFRNFA